MKWHPRALVAVTGSLALISAFGSAESLMIDDPLPSQVDFQLLDTPVVAPQSRVLSETRESSRAGSTVVALSDDALVLDADSGDLVRVNREGRVSARVPIQARAAQMVFDVRTMRAYVSDRMGDRVVVVDVGRTLEVSHTLHTRAEPYGLALTPRSTDRPDPLLLVTTVAGRQLSAYRTVTGEELWSVEIGPEPRGIAVAPDGERAVVTFLQTAAVARLLLRHEVPPIVRFTALDRQKPVSPTSDMVFTQATPVGRVSLVHENVGQSTARAAFSAVYLHGDVLVVPHQDSMPHQTMEREDTGVYGGGGLSPVEHRLSFIADRANSVSREGRVGQAAIGVHQPRAIAYDQSADMLYIAGYGSDEVMALRHASTPSVRLAWRVKVPGPGCGPNGLAVGERGKVLVYCELTRTLATFESASDRQSAAVVMSEPLSQSRLSPAAQRGRDLFRQGGNPATSNFGLLACTSCHPEARTDGLSWRIQGQSLQTPLLSGRVAGTHPFKWDGGDKTLSQSLRNTVTRLGGNGITERQAQDLQAFLESLPRPRTPRARDANAVARGEALFRSERTGCADCHSGAKLTDRKSHGLTRDLPQVDTPSLIGLAASAPYYHDGSAASLRAVLMENGSIHGMGNTDGLSEHNINDLIGYLETL